MLLWLKRSTNPSKTTPTVTVAPIINIILSALREEAINKCLSESIYKHSKQNISALFLIFGLPVISSLIAGFTGVVSAKVKIPSAVRVLPGSEDRKMLTLEKKDMPTFYEKSI